MDHVLELYCPEEIYESILAEGVDDIHLHQVAREGLAVRLFSKQLLSVGKAAELSGLPLIRFMELLQSMGIAVVEYGESEYQRDLATMAALSTCKR